MSGIFNGDSIYKSGGGGGGYKDGGALVDGDYIEVSNNTVSTYENESRNEINFYFDPKDGEILNSVIELTNDVNATVNVYYLNDNLIFVPLGYIGSNTVNAGEQYNINVTGNGFIIEPVTPAAVDPNEYITLLYGHGCKFKKIGNYYWQTEDNHSVITGVRYINANNTTYYNLKDLYAKNNQFENGYKLPLNNEPMDLYNTLGGSNAGKKLKDVVGWAASSYPGDNSAGLNFQGKGAYVNGNVIDLNRTCYFARASSAGASTSISCVYNSYFFGNTNLTNDYDKAYVCIRFVKHA